jgi:histidinol-phosphate aminotransferase
MSATPNSFWTHGGPDPLGAPRFDFSTNSNACGPCPQALAAVAAADGRSYPDPAYAALRRSLAGFHGVAPERLLLAGSASEFIFRFTAWARQQGLRFVSLPTHHYADYARAAQAWGLVPFDPTRSAEPAVDRSTLHWACEPSSPLGQAHTRWPAWLLQSPLDKDPPSAAVAPASVRSLLVLDRAYAPLRLSGEASLTQAQLDRTWQLFTPNKALGLTGVRAAYAIAPQGDQAAVNALELLAPSWPVGAHGVAMLQAWVTPAVQVWLTDSLHLLRDWKERQIRLLQDMGWQVATSDANYFCARPAQAPDLAALRQTHGIKLRDASSFGLPGWFRLGVLAPQAQDVLAAALQHAKPRFITLETSTI